MEKNTSALAVIILVALISSSFILCSSTCNESKTNSLFVLSILVVLALLSSIQFSPSDNIDPYMYAAGELLKNNPKVEGCCLYPENEQCKKFTSEEIQASCCRKGFAGRKVTFASAPESGYTKCQTMMKMNKHK